ncbi:hypothetical protein ABL78_1770 [Leptomonas seymouri]|uniref:Uncharacterized protein n=1 Tax=Leptomonas seymouri TaxID=5684 RepID=A0A0N0P7T0_LEPSE|nr:hypothetical protein ABL78_1770 [Leptomonas seymouri]|eukprot:KPI89126.1 hypothetical protein ABL78_1770 [Leptomonas seymouri]
MDAKAPLHDVDLLRRQTVIGSNERSDMYVTSLDVFNRRAYFDPQKENFTDAQIGSFGATTPFASQGDKKVEKNLASSEVQYNDDHVESNIELKESAVCRLKQFSTPEAYGVANSVKDDLHDTLGESDPAQIYVNKTSLLEKRQLFFETLFTHTDDLHTALPCRFSIEDVLRLFQDDDQMGSVYQKRLAALERLRETLDC